MLGYQWHLPGCNTFSYAVRPLDIPRRKETAALYHLKCQKGGRKRLPSGFAGRCILPDCLCLMVPGSSPALGMCQVENGERGCVSLHFLWVHMGHPHTMGGPGAQGGGSGLAFGVPAVDPVALDPSRADLSRAWLQWNKLGGTSPFSEGHPAVGSGDPFPSLSWDKTLLLG